MLTDVPGAAVCRRPCLPFVPRWEGECKGYAYNAMRRFWPTLQAWYEWDDLMQEAFLVFLKCKRRYYTFVDTPQWFMALFKTSLHNRLVNLVVSVPRYSLTEEGVSDALVVPDIARELWELTRDLPRELQVVLGDVCRLRPRFNFSKRALRELRLALASH